ncbi:EAL domain-containing protein [Saccharopolyspora sp. NPDC049357]|uniref:sensor domain-containing protein n=1 Tax=Saccharopolyspora sp. NPDC049357 TaxID=3154507 RepID=UPI00344AD436
MTEGHRVADVSAFVGPFGQSLDDYAVCTLDASGTVTSWNHGAERILGAAAAERIGGVAEFYTPEQIADGHPEKLLEQAREQGSHVDEGWRVREDGRWFWANVVTTALWSPEGDLRGYARLTRDDTTVHQQLEIELRDAIDDDALTLHYQPVVAADGTIRTCESLLRWEHPERGLLSPGTILPVAERAGMLADLDAWVLGRALRDAATWPVPPGGKPVSVAVNVAELMPGDPAFNQLLERLVSETGIAWDRIVIELVETAIVDVPSRMHDSMNDLRTLGVRFSIDDFGTGYSSLTRVRDFPAQAIKIDRTFVQDITTSRVDRMLVSTITDLAAALDCVTVAEGVETREQFEILRSMEVDAYQGWLFSKAVPGPDLAQLVEAGPIPR